MKAFGRAVSIALIVLILVIATVYVDGVMMPVDHTTTVTDMVNAPPAKVFATITNVANGAFWRKSVISVRMLPQDAGRDRWVEELKSGDKMSFIALRTEAVDANGVGRRDVMLNDPNASYGGTWTYSLSPGDSPRQTRLSITEAGFIHPPIYRFIMRYLVGMNANLEQYMVDIKAAVAK